MLCIGVNKIKIHFDTSQLCCGEVHLEKIERSETINLQSSIVDIQFRLVRVGNI
jgi:hypothetical protein